MQCDGNATLCVSSVTSRPRPAQTACITVSTGEIELHIHHDFPRIHRQVRVVERPIELFLSRRLVCGVVVWGEVLMREGVGGLDTFPGVENEHLFEEINGYIRVSYKLRAYRVEVV